MQRCWRLALPPALPAFYNPIDSQFVVPGPIDRYHVLSVVVVWLGRASGGLQGGVLTGFSYASTHKVYLLADLRLIQVIYGWLNG